MKSLKRILHLNVTNIIFVIPDPSEDPRLLARGLSYVALRKLSVRRRVTSLLRGKPERWDINNRLTNDKAMGGVGRKVNNNYRGLLPSHSHPSNGDFLSFCATW